MNNIYILGILVETIIFCGITYFLYGSFFRINNIFNMLWGILSIIAPIASERLGTVLPSNEIYKMILICILFFNIIYFIFSPKNLKVVWSEISNNLFINTQLIKYGFFLALLLYLPNFIVSIKTLLISGNFASVREGYVSISSEGNGLYAYLTKNIPNSITIAISLLGAYGLSVKDYTTTKYALVLLGINLICFGGRSYILYFVIFYIVIYFMNSNRKKIKFKKRYFIGILSIIIVITLSRGLGQYNLLDMIYLYFFQQLSFTQYIINHASEYGLLDLHYGVLTFGFLLAPVVLFFKLFYSNAILPSDYFDIHAQIPVNIAQDFQNHLVVINNNTGFLYYFLLDYGFNFYFLGAIFYALIITFIERRIVRKKSSFYFYVYILVFQGIINSASNYNLTSITTSFTIIFLFIMTRKINFKFK